jgi:RNA 2',3'-cyclic 3'-phosphodiesterase
MRLFTGIAVAPHVRDNLARVLKELRPLAPLNWSPVENLHVTSKFIGEWPEARLTELGKTLGNLNLPAGFEVAISRFGYFPNPHNPRTLFAGVHAGPGLAELAARIDEALILLGLARESRPYSPHLTLARIKHENIRELREHIANMTNLDFGTFQVSEFHLYHIKTTSAGSVYTPLTTCPLPAAVNIQAGSRQ